MTNADKYRDTSRYRNSGSPRNNINLGSNPQPSHNTGFSSGNHLIDQDNLDYKTTQYSRTSEQKYSHKHIKKTQRAKKRRNTIRTAVIVCILAVIGIAVWKFWPIKVTINGQEQTLSYDKSLAQVVKQSGITVNPGDFVAVDFSIITKGEGNEYYAEVNGQEVENMAYKLHNNDEIKYENGKDVMEEYNSNDSKVVAKSTMKGYGSIHKFSGTGEPGVWSEMKGKVSGKYAERQTKDPDDVNVSFYSVNPGKDKVIALTFDDGPSNEFTQDILDLLKKYDAKATFFVVGENVEEDWGKNLVKKEDAAGHQVCTHSYDHARSAGGIDMTIMTAEKQIEEITKGQKVIAKAIGHDASSVVRLPGGNISEVTCRLIAPYVSAEIGWNIDTGDWQKPGSDKILQNMKLAASGDVILCHDGGGDREETVIALEKFLKEYTEKGYKFITIDELMEYEPAVQKDTSSAPVSTYNNKYTD